MIHLVRPPLVSGGARLVCESDSELLVDLGLPDGRLLLLPLRDLLLRPQTSAATRDAVWRELIRRARLDVQLAGRDVVDLDPAFGEQFLDVAVRQPAAVDAA